jgi:hypothetical protein
LGFGACKEQTEKKPLRANSQLLDRNRVETVGEDGSETIPGVETPDAFFDGRKGATIPSEALRAFVRERKKFVPANFRFGTRP